MNHDTSSALGTPHSPSLLTITTLLTTLVLLVAILFRALPIVQSSLWNDELFTILEFSSKGPLYVITNYSVPNNHIFFNFLNSLLPTAGSVAPLTARGISLVALLFFLGLSLQLILRRNTLWAGMLPLFLFMDGRFLELFVQARGYGLLALFSLVQCILVLRLTKLNEAKTYWFISLWSIAGCWTVPTYTFFAVPLHLMLLLTGGWRHIASLFLFPAISLTVAYAPVLKELIQNFTSYKSEHGVFFPDLSSLLILTRDYIHIHTYWFWIGSFCLVLFAIIFSPQGEKRSHIVLFITLLLFFTILLLVKTSVPRSVAYILVAYLFLLGASLDRLTLHFSSWLNPCASLLTLVLACFCAYNIHRSAPYVPIESWKETAEYLDDHHTGKKLYAPFRSRFLEVYLKAPFTFATSFNKADFLSGKLVVVENDFKNNRTLHIPARFPEAEQKIIPQQRGGSQTLFWVPEAH